MENRKNENGADMGRGEGTRDAHRSHTNIPRSANPLDEIGPEVNRQIDELRGRFDDTLETVSGFIRQRPATSLLVAVGVGYLFGRIVRS